MVVWQNHLRSGNRYTGKAFYDRAAIEITCHDHFMLLRSARYYILSASFDIYLWWLSHHFAMWWYLYHYTTNMSLFFLARLGSITQKQKLQTSTISSKANTLSVNPCLPLVTFHGESSYTYTGQAFSLTLAKKIFQTYHASFYTVCNKITWLSVIRTHCLPALPALNTGMRQNAKVSCTFLVDASFGKNVLVENATLQQSVSKENHQGVKFKVFLMKTTIKKIPKKATIANNFRPNRGASNANETTFRPSFNKNFYTYVFVYSCRLKLQKNCGLHSSQFHTRHRNVDLA